MHQDPKIPGKLPRMVSKPLPFCTKHTLRTEDKEIWNPILGAQEVTFRAMQYAYVNRMSPNVTGYSRISPDTIGCH